MEAELWGRGKKEARGQPRRLLQTSSDDAGLRQVEAMDAENGRWAQGLVAGPWEESRRPPNFWCEQPSGQRWYHCNGAWRRIKSLEGIQTAVLDPLG